MISSLRSGLKSMITARSRQAQYSSIGPFFAKQLGIQKPLYSPNVRVRADVRG